MSRRDDLAVEIAELEDEISILLYDIDAIEDEMASLDKDEYADEYKELSEDREALLGELATMEIRLEELQLDMDEYE